MQNPAFGNDAVVNIRAGIVGQCNRVSSQTSAKIFEEMEFQEIVEKNQRNNEKANEVMPNGNE